MDLRLGGELSESLFPPCGLCLLGGDWSESDSESCLLDSFLGGDWSESDESCLTLGFRDID